MKVATPESFKIVFAGAVGSGISAFALWALAIVTESNKLGLLGMLAFFAACFCWGFAAWMHTYYYTQIQELPKPESEPENPYGPGSGSGFEEVPGY